MASAGNDIDGLGLLFMRPIQEAIVNVGNYTTLGGLRPPFADNTTATAMDNGG